MSKQKKSDDAEASEAVDGPAIAAKILQAMPQDKRERILKAIQIKDPQISIKVEDNLFNFNDIETLTDQGMQVLVASIAQTDLVLSFKLASPKIKEKFLKNMSERKAKLVAEDFQAIGKVKKTDVEDAQRRILKTLDELRTSGQIRSQSKNDVWV